MSTSSQLKFSSEFPTYIAVWDARVLFSWKFHNFNKCFHILLRVWLFGKSSLYPIFARLASPLLILPKRAHKKRLRIKTKKVFHQADKLFADPPRGQQTMPNSAYKPHSEPPHTPVVKRGHDYQTTQPFPQDKGGTLQAATKLNPPHSRRPSRHHPAKPHDPRGGGTTAPCIRTIRRLGANHCVQEYRTEHLREQ